MSTYFSYVKKKFFILFQYQKIQINILVNVLMNGYVLILIVLIVEHQLLLIYHEQQQQEDVDNEHVQDEI